MRTQSLARLKWLETKICSKCGGVVEDVPAKTGRRCRACLNKIAADYSRRHPGRLAAAHKQWLAANQERHERSCRQSHWRQKGIKITWAEYDALLKSQRGRCAICQTADPGKRAFAVDHDGAFGHVRGLLCGNCNRGIGSLRHSPVVLRAAAKYLEAHQPKLKLAGD